MCIRDSPRGNGVGINLPSIDETLEIGKGRVIQEGKKVALLNFGTRLEQCKVASETLLKKGITCTIVDARFAKPLDEKLIMEVASNHDLKLLPLLTFHLKVLQIWHLQLYTLYLSLTKFQKPLCIAPIVYQNLVKQLFFLLE